MALPVKFSEAYLGAVKGQKTEMPHTHADLSGCTVIVTGANTGLGKELAAKFAAMRPQKLILAVRTISKGEAARDQFVQKTPSLDASSIDVWQLDMADFASVKAFAQRAEAELTRLDVVELNAGISEPNWKLTKDGWESALQVNCIATYYLLLLLLPLLRRTAKTLYPSQVPNGLTQPHISIVSSGLHYTAPFKEHGATGILDAMNTQTKGSTGNPRYSDTKLLGVLWVQELARRLEKHSGDSEQAVVINATSPGFCYSGLTDASVAGKPLAALFMRAFKWVLARPTEMGARVLVWGALRADATQLYVARCQDEVPRAWTTSEEGVKVAGKLWDETLWVLGKFDPELASKTTGLVA